MNAVETGSHGGAGWDLCALEVEEGRDEGESGWKVVVRKKSEMLRVKREKKAEGAGNDATGWRREARTRRREHADR